jgi:hypothetical protein
MVVNRELLNAIGARVDQTKTMHLAGSKLEFSERSIGRARAAILGERAVEVVLAVDQVVVRDRNDGRNLDEQLAHSQCIQVEQLTFGTPPTIGTTAMTCSTTLK